MSIGMVASLTKLGLYLMNRTVAGITFIKKHLDL